MNYPGFIGPSNTLRSPIADSERTVNWYYEPITPGSGPGGARGYLKPTPGIEPYVVLPKAPIRQLWSQDGHCYVVAGNGFYEITAGRTYVLRGLIAVDSRPVSISSNGSAGNQAYIVSGGFGYTYDLSTGVVTQISDPDYPNPATMGAFIDGYFLALKGRSNQFQWSALEDGTSWNGLDVAQLSQSSDYIQSITAVHGQLYILGSKTSVVWANTGGSSAFEPIPGSLGMQGSIAPWSATVLDNTLMWLGGNDQGACMVFRMNGYTPERVSTHAVESALQSYGRVSDAIGWTCQIDGHAIYVLYLPTADVQWAYDASTQFWFEWAVWNVDALRYEPWVARCHTFCYGQHLIGDRQSGAVYRMSPDIATSQLVVMG